MKLVFEDKEISSAMICYLDNRSLSFWSRHCKLSQLYSREERINRAFQVLAEKNSPRCKLKTVFIFLSQHVDSALNHRLYQFLHHYYTRCNEGKPSFSTPHYTLLASLAKQYYIEPIFTPDFIDSIMNRESIPSQLARQYQPNLEELFLLLEDPTKRRELSHIFQKVYCVTSSYENGQILLNGLTKKELIIRLEQSIPTDYPPEEPESSRPDFGCSIS